ncbi:GNAT family N-acetyltransferase [Bacillus sp. 2205SS5-2]|uniref:GNAT family N-acetyltransferase n=1 Tax=Bacillus sp. 2205SS5-2 TaxID=3109031 RepID=UPI0030069C1E
MLSEQRIAQIEELQKLCEKEEDISLKLNWDILKNRRTEEKRDFFHEQDGILVGFLALYWFGTKVELCGMVHPEYRRQGIFTNLLKEAMSLCDKDNRVSLLFNAPAASQSAKCFLLHKPFSYRFSEYQMKWIGSEMEKCDDVLLKRATEEDASLEIQLDVSCFGFTEADAIAFHQRMKEEETDRFMIEVEGETVGKIRIDHTEGEAWIYGFSIFPRYQGKGIGRKTLKKVISSEQEKGYPVFLEVEASNKHALRLYTDCGFSSFSVQDYYERGLSK